jgi:hypothetical protein
MHPTPYVASLRVYEPIEVFEIANQVLWSQSKNLLSTGREEQIRSLKRAITNEPPNFSHDGAHFLLHKGDRYLAPWSTSARCWAALQDFKFTIPSSLVKFFISSTFEDVLSKTIEIVEDKVPHILTSTWSIPPRWFALFSSDERISGVNEDGNFIIFRTPISSAKSRCIFTHQAVRGAFGEGAVEAEVSELLRWLEIFDGKSIVELDYGGLANILSKQLTLQGEAGLDADTSIEDVTSSIAGLASGDGALAGKGYERLVSRWRKVSTLESAS